MHISKCRCAHSCLVCFAYLPVSLCLGLCLHLHTCLSGVCAHPVCVAGLCVWLGPCLGCVLWQLLPVVSTAVGPHLLLCLPISPSLPPDSSEASTPLRLPGTAVGLWGCEVWFLRGWDKASWARRGSRQHRPSPKGLPGQALVEAGCGGRGPRGQAKRGQEG